MKEIGTVVDYKRSDDSGRVRAHIDNTFLDFSFFDRQYLPDERRPREGEQIEFERVKCNGHTYANNWQFYSVETEAADTLRAHALM